MIILVGVYLNLKKWVLYKIKILLRLGISFRIRLFDKIFFEL